MGFKNYILIFGIILHCQAVLGIWQCLEDTDCVGMSGSICENTECVCPKPLQSTLGGTVCAEGAPYYQSPCYEDFQCSRLVFNFECRRPANASNVEAGICACQPDHHYFKGRCWPSRRWGEECSHDEECMPLLRDPFSLSCYDGVCECSEGYYLRQRGECRKSGMAVGDGCVLNEDCLFDNGACDTSTFTCVISNNVDELSVKQTSLSTSELPKAASQSSLVRQHGEECDGHCADPFECTSLGFCACPRGYYPNTAGTNCLAELGSPVSSSDQCVGFFTEVHDGACKCQANFYFDEDMRSCVKVVTKLSDFCSNDLSCQTFGAFTRCGSPQQWGLRNCECIPEETKWNADVNMCMLFAGVGEQCEVDSDCIAGELEILCLTNDQGQGICSCPEEYDAVDGLCLLLGQELGETCQVNTECTGTPNTICAGGLCVCGDGYQQDGDYCAPVIGSSCEEDSNCVIADTICAPATNTCQCSSEFVEYNDICWPVANGYDSPCNVTAQCLVSLGEGSSCSDGNCTCSGDHHYNDGECWPRTALFESCSRSSQCFLEEKTERVQCRNSLCQCTFEYPYSEELKTCTSSGAGIIVNYISILTGLLYLYLC